MFRSRCGTYFDSVCAKPVGLSCLRIECHFIHTSSVWDWHIPIRSMTCVQVGETLVLNATEIVNGKFTLCFSWEFELRLSCFMRRDPSEHTLLTVPLDTNAVSDECLKSHRVGIVSHSTYVWKCFTTQTSPELKRPMQTPWSNTPFGHVFSSSSSWWVTRGRSTYVATNKYFTTDKWSTKLVNLL